MSSKVVTVNFQKGGVGKSLLSWNISYCLRQIHEKNVAIIDLDLQETCTDYSLMREFNKWNGIFVPVYRIDLKEPLIEFIQKKEFDYYIIDCGGFDMGLNRVATAIADVVLTPTTYRPAEMLAFRKFLNQLNEISNEIGRNVVANVVRNNIHTRQKDFSDLEEICANNSQHLKLAKTIVRSRTELAMCVGSGQQIFERTLKSAAIAKKEIIALVDELILAK